MPFTPFHMGPGLLLKGLLRGSFSVIIFGWAQIIMDLQPLFVLLTGHGHLHGFSHTLIGATLLTVVSGLSGRYLLLASHRFLPGAWRAAFSVSWWTTLTSATIGCYSHVLLDAVMHRDLEPFAPFSQINPWLDPEHIGLLHTLCLLAGIVGALLIAVFTWADRKSKLRRPR